MVLPEKQKGPIPEDLTPSRSEHFRRADIMDILLKKEEGLVREFSVTISYDAFLAQERQKLTSVSQKVKMDGFRPGKAPLSLVKAQYGDRVKGEVFHTLFEQGSKKIITEHALNVAGAPTVSIEMFKEKEPIVLHYTVEVIPDVPLIDPKSIDIPEYILFPSQEAIAARVKKIKFYISEKTSLNRPADYGDTVIYKEFGFDHDTGHGDGDDDRLFFTTLSKDDPISERFLGRSAGDHFHYDKVSKDNDGSDHEHHHHSRRHVRIDDVVSLSNPLDNEKILKAFEAEGPEEGLRKAARSELIVEMRPLAREGRQRSLLETLENRYVFPLPRVMIQSEKETIINEYEEGSFDSQEDAEDLEKMANRRVSLAFLFLKYASVHNIQVTNEDMTRFLLEQVEGDRQRFAKTIEALKKNQQQLVALRNAVLETKVVADLLNKISGTKRYALFSDFLLEKQSSFIQKMKNSAE